MNTTNIGYEGCGIDNSNGVANTMAGATIILISDIDYNPNFIFNINLETGAPIIIDKSTGLESTETPISWIPISWGYYDTNEQYQSFTFNGTFEGNELTISGLYFEEVENNGEEVGLFGKLDGAEIRNVVLDNSYIGGKQAGGIAGNATNSSITNCYNNSNINGSFAGGGIVALSNSTIITNCFNTGNIIASSNTLGGIAGIIENNSEISSCGNTGNIKLVVL